jgi:hypothetical protein
MTFQNNIMNFRKVKYIWVHVCSIFKKYEKYVYMYILKLCESSQIYKHDAYQCFMIIGFLF